MSNTGKNVFDKITSTLERCIKVLIKQYFKLIKYKFCALKNLLGFILPCVKYF